MDQQERINDIKEYLYSSMTDSTWKKELRWFFYDKPIENIIKFLDNQYNTGYKWNPKPEKIFEAFNYNNYDNLKVVIINSEPSSNYLISRGLSFSLSESKSIKPYFYKEFLKSAQLLNPSKTEINFDDWCNQGALLLNLSLTSTHKSRNKYIDLWKPFREYLFDNLKDKNLVYIFVGKSIWEYSTELDSDNIFKVTNPSSLRHTNNKNWSDQSIFIEVNNKLKQLNKDEIKW